MATSRKPERMDIDPRVKALSPEARVCRARGRHDWPDLETALRQALRGNKTLINMSQIELELQCKCGATVTEEYNVFGGDTIGRRGGYAKAEGYLMPPGTGRLARSAVRAAVFRDVFAEARRKR